MTNDGLEPGDRGVNRARARHPFRRETQWYRHYRARPNVISQGLNPLLPKR